MTRFKRLILANAMILGNVVANTVGVLAVEALDRWGFISLTPRIPAIMALIPYFSLAATIVGVSVLRWWERPLRRFLGDLAQGRETPPEALALAQRRLLNEPWLAMALNLAIWAIAALFFASLVGLYAESAHSAGVVILRSLFVGLITVTAAFFLLEHILQHQLAPVVFPQGGLTEVKGAWRVRIGFRLAALVLAACMIPFTAIIFTIQGAARLLESGRAAPLEVLGNLQAAVLFLCLFFMVNAAALAFFLTTNLVRPLREIIRVLGRVRRGEFDSRVQVMANDEIGYTGEAINRMTAGLAERERIKDTFGKYVSRQVRDEILSGRIPLDGEVKQVTVLFSDLRDFTPMVETTPPKEVVAILNGYFSRMTTAIEEQDGLVLQYVGDEIEAVFGAPLALADHPRRALAAALAMRRGLAAYNAELAARGGPTLRHGIGIHSGPVVAANIGGGGRLSYTLVGDTVNLAARLQDLTKKLGRDILVSGVTAAALGEGAALEHLQATLVKGRSQPVEVFAAL
jgi:adenylate cyclase